MRVRIYCFERNPRHLIKMKGLRFMRISPKHLTPPLVILLVLVFVNGKRNNGVLSASVSGTLQ
jgi:hypothetical protein